MQASQSVKKHKKINKQQSKSQPKGSKVAKTLQAKKDSRFQKANYDPKFLTPSAKLTKTKIDKRFASMINDSTFETSSGVDRYGRRLSKQSKNQLAQYYYMEDDQQDELDDNMQEQQQYDEQIEQNQQQKEGDDHQGIREWMQNYNEESSSLEDVPLDDQEEAQVSDVWSDQSEKVVKGEDVASTKRLALCNYDWMNINAKDLMLLFNSFKTQSGVIKSIRVYMSNIGKEKLAQQQLHGPQNIWKETKEQQQKAGWRKSWKELLQERADDGLAFDQHKLRKYQKQRLKYFYAVIDCDSKATAQEIYKQCDSNQFENSNLNFDLRFVPDDLKFDQAQLKQECLELPTAGEVRNFISRAMGHTKVSLSWQDPQLSRTAALKSRDWSKLSQKDLQKIDWGMYMDQGQEAQNEGMKKLLKETVDEKEILTDWRKTANKKYNKSQQDIQITFEGGFNSQKKKQNNVEQPSLNKQKKSMKERRRQHEQQKRKRREQLQLMVDDQKMEEVKVNLNDDRFSAVYNNPLYAIDPQDPKFDHRRNGQIFGEVVRRNRGKNRE